MPGYKGHIVGGLAAYFVVVLLCSCMQSSWVLLTQGLLFTCLGALFPDIDTKSKGQKFFYTLLCAACIALLLNQFYIMVAFIATIAFLPLMVPHRGLFHNFWFIMVFIIMTSFMLITFFPLYKMSILKNAAFFMLGVLSHLLLDFGISRTFRLR